MRDETRGVSPNEDTRSALINTPLQWGADGREEFENRFNGFPSAEQTVETVQFPHRSSGTPLKWGVNEMSSNRSHSEMRGEMSEGCGARPSGRFNVERANGVEIWQ